MKTDPDLLARTAPSRPPAALSNYQPIRVPLREDGFSRFKRGLGWGCGWIFLLSLLALGLYFFAPAQTTLLVLGVDGGQGRGDLGRSDTIILAGVNPLYPSVNLLSIPRDLWVEQPDGSQNRINTAFFFAEAEQPGSGARAAGQVVYKNFGVPVDYTVVLRMDGLVGIVDALGGVEIVLQAPNAGYPAGTHRLNGEQALAFARNRSGSDDFGRMQQGQILLRAVMREILKPASWPNLPAFYLAVREAAQFDIPVWQWPRLGLALLRAGPAGIETRAIEREMVTPFTTEAGAQVLAPNWGSILPLVRELFGH
jgi:LCP family protein required for cell wall assembly